MPYPEPQARPSPWPRANLLCLAPLDTWARLLAGAWNRGWRPRLVDLLRLALALSISAFSTLLTLPERLLGAVLARPRAKPFDRDLIVITGYYRSGTTHLHNLLSCDRRVVTPRWVQALAPQGGWVSWTALRLAMLPFVPNTRPQDDVPFGPWWPAEDDFALAAGSGTSPLPGRLLFPSQRAHWARFHTLDGLSEAERTRWQRSLVGFLRKLTLTRRRPILLKNPTHTAHLAALAALTTGRVRVIHLTRDRASVLASNLRLHDRLEPHAFEALPSRAALQDAITQELDETEQRFVAFAADPGPRVQLARVEFAELLTNPVATVQRIYAELDLADLELDWNQAMAEQVETYLLRTESIKPAGATPQEDKPGEDGGSTWNMRMRTDPATRPIAWMVPPIAASGCLVAWLGLAHVLGERLDWSVWIWGVVIGWAGLAAARVGSARFGVWCGVCLLGLVGASVWWLPEVASGWTGEDRIRNIRSAYWTVPTTVHVMIVLGAITAWRVGSRRHATPPGA